MVKGGGQRRRGTDRGREGQRGRWTYSEGETEIEGDEGQTQGGTGGGTE